MMPRLCALLAVLATVAAPPLGAQADPAGRWHTIETTHFDVHVRPQQRDLGVRAAAEAEAAYVALEALLVPPRGRIDLVVADDWDEANGFATVIPSPRVVVFAAAPAGDIALEPYDRWLRLVITHELAHLFHLDRTRGWWRAVQSVLGRVPGLFPNAYTPTWLSEGLAVLLESRLTDAGRLEGSFHRAVVHAAAVEGGGMPLDAAGGLSPRWPAGLRPYAFGGAFFGHVATAGDSVVRGLVEAIAQRPLPYLQLNGALASAGGPRLTTAWRDWQQRVRDSLAGRRDGGRAARPDTGAVVLRRGQRLVVPPRLSPDGGRLLFAEADGREVPWLVALDRARGSWTRLGRLSGVNGVAWHGAATALVSQLDFTDPYTARSDLWQLGGGERRLTRGARLLHADVAPDGEVVAVRIGTRGHELVGWRDGVLRVLAEPEPGVEWAHPRVAPDNRAIAAVRVRHGRSDIVLLERDGRIVRALTDDRVPDRTPAFTPDAAAVVWSRDVRGAPQIVGVLLGRDTSAFLLTDEPFAAYAPAPATDSLYYLAYHHDGFRLVVRAWEARPWPLPAPEVSPPPPPSGPAPAMIRAEHPYRPWRSLAPRFWLPVAYGEAGYGWYGGLTAGADVLLRHVLVGYAAIGSGAVAGEWQGALAYRFAPWSRFAADLYAERRSELTVIPGPLGGVSSACCYVDELAEIGLTWTRLRWRSVLAARAAADVERERGGGADADARGVRVSAVYSNAVTPALAISPRRGWRIGASVRPRWQSGGRHRLETTVEAATYLAGRGSRFAAPGLAVRVAAGALDGNDGSLFRVGGAPGGDLPVAPGLTLGSGAPAFGVRGSDPGTITGRRVVALSVEHREPIALVGRGLGLLPFTYDRLSLAVFFDGAAAFTFAGCATDVPPQWCPTFLSSLGAEIVSDLGVGYDFPVRLRVGVAQVLGEHRRSRGYVALGSAF